MNIREYVGFEAKHKQWDFYSRPNRQVKRNFEFRFANRENISRNIDFGPSGLQLHQNVTTTSEASGSEGER